MTWKKGQSGNPAGRPPGTGLRGVAKAVAKRFGEDGQQLVDHLAGFLPGQKDLCPVCQSVLTKNIPAQMRALEMLLDRGYGKPQQTHEVQGADGAPLEVIKVVLSSDVVREHKGGDDG